MLTKGMLQQYHNIREGMPGEIKHSAKGSTWESHKYVKKVDGTYYYPSGYTKGRTIDSLKGESGKSDDDSDENEKEAHRKRLEEFDKKKKELLEKGEAYEGNGPDSDDSETYSDMDFERFKEYWESYDGEGKYSDAELKKMLKNFQAKEKGDYNELLDDMAERMKGDGENEKDFSNMDLDEFTKYYKSRYGDDGPQLNKAQMKNLLKTAQERSGGTSKSDDDDKGDYSEEDIEELARGVLRGDYGNGAQRKELLGDNYDKIQAKVNELARSQKSSSSESGSSSSTTKKAESQNAPKRTASKSTSNTKKVQSVYERQGARMAAQNDAEYNKKLELAAKKKKKKS